MPSRTSDRHHRDRAVYDDSDSYDDDHRPRPRASRRVSRSVHDVDPAEAGRSHRRRDRYEDVSPARPARARSLDHRPRPRRRDSYDDYSTDSEEDRRRRRRDKDRGRTGTRARGSRPPPSTRSRVRRDSDKSHIIQAAASAAVVAGATEAWRMRNEKTSWSKKGTKMATAAAGAAAIAAFKDGGNNSGSGRRNSESRSRKDAIGATIGGLLVNRLANGVGGGGGRR
ncbi:hypothetical protein C8034_v003829 [Colletotrichum sidae]|uniref:DUF3824 domain-containing protein n=1 Tax=Colletotrichum sidae TaxID=1347389 RepID=A0A4V3I2B7_9PEZI|nr:hypothetical protein C8034_v003829 [Colletotrichum sidae]